ncbi:MULTISPECIES: hypothetical protein [Pseudomonas]
MSTNLGAIHIITHAYLDVESQRFDAVRTSADDQQLLNARCGQFVETGPLQG